MLYTIFRTGVSLPHPGSSFRHVRRVPGQEEDLIRYEFLFVNLDVMTQLNLMERKGTRAVKRLRLQKLKSGYPFMINSSDLKRNQCYLEYPDGIIKLVSVTPSARDFSVIRQLSPVEADMLRQKYKLSG